MDFLICKEELEQIKLNVKTVDYVQILRGKKGVLIVHPFYLISGYGVTYTIDIMPEMSPVHHVSIGHIKRKLDPADANIIARAILGIPYLDYGSHDNPGVMHFYNSENMSELEGLLGKKKR